MIKNASTTLSNETDSEPTTDPEKLWAEAGLAQHYLSLPNLESNRARKWIGLKSLGYSEEECDELCRPKEIDRDEVMREVAESGEAGLIFDGV